MRGICYCGWKRLRQRFPGLVVWVWWGRGGRFEIPDAQVAPPPH